MNEPLSYIHIMLVQTIYALSSLYKWISIIINDVSQNNPSSSEQFLQSNGKINSSKKLKKKKMCKNKVKHSYRYISYTLQEGIICLMGYYNFHNHNHLQ